MSPQQSPFPSSTTTTTATMAKSPIRSKAYSFFTDTLLFVGGSMAGLLLVWVLWSFVNPDSTSSGNPNFPSSPTQTKPTISDLPFTCSDLLSDPPASTFYDDPDLSYSIGKPIKNWDEKRRNWLNHHPSFIAGLQDRLFLVTGSQPSPCRNPIGDHLLLKFFKNKVDYCRIHGYDIFYNDALLNPKMPSFWAKLPLVRATMVAHPESEWIWWVDSDAAFTDMEFKLPLKRYQNHNLIVHGWAPLIYEKKSWVGLNAGVFLIRNCQWSIDFMEIWASMGPQTAEYATWSKTLKSALPDKLYPESDDQSALIYLLLKEKEKWGDKIYLESEYYFEGYWLEIVGTLENVGEKYVEIERENEGLRRRHGEKVSEYYGVERERYLEEGGYEYGKGGRRRPFITHFAGCQPCSGDHNQIYSGDSCWNGMQRALNFADNQVLRNFGFVRRNLLNSSSVSSLPFDFPA